RPKPRDIICVLGGGGYVRLEKGISLYKEGYAPQLFFALPEIIPHGTPYGDLIDQEKTICKAILEYRDVPASDVLWSKKIFFSTFEEITYIKGLLEEKSLQSAIIVPGWFQSRRAKWTVDTIIGSQKELLIVPAPEDSFDTREWWKDMDGFIMVENELMKNLYYFFKY
ncbi:hypothetical protein GF373_10105, partial [bacterium]|nr:hypothetical protein [bacterium]